MSSTQIKKGYCYTPIRMDKIQNMTTLNSGDKEQQEFSFTVGGIQNDTAAILEDSLSVSCNT